MHSYHYVTGSIDPQSRPIMAHLEATQQLKSASSHTVACNQSSNLQDQISSSAIVTVVYQPQQHMEAHPAL